MLASVADAMGQRMQVRRAAIQRFMSCASAAWMTNSWPPVMVLAASGGSPASAIPLGPPPPPQFSSAHLMTIVFSWSGISRAVVGRTSIRSRQKMPARGREDYVKKETCF